jgi:hypothetical protein
MGSNETLSFRKVDLENVEMKHGTKFCKLAIITFVKISKNHLKHFTFTQKSTESFISKIETPQPVLPFCCLYESNFRGFPYMKMSDVKSE